jgi:hypothetical protein
MTPKSARERRVNPERRAHPRGGRRSSDHHETRDLHDKQIDEYQKKRPKKSA